ncbi:nucleotidyltransferase domain-containing protein [Paenibacillus ginsengarvi]|uniref:DUF4111 domain-containing protein n=1 Tax=Paenibacillus ginsengarvi TaxID=400777 RepID=A0A3B0CFS8_9BACL|nr:nucleotidyltransferase domain-containing protein [Paenibacillus ginsengarvi]RKN84765.1 DUF4111 domain-containing protein [Paenibacillus ginsengarvi]
MVPAIVGKTMSRLCAALEINCPGLIEAVYLYGSTALGAYVEGASDIDFIAVFRRPPGPGQLLAIEAAHEELAKTLPGTDIMGAYLLREQLGKPDGEIGSVPVYFNGALHLDGKGADLNPVTWWILKKHGICVYGEKVPFDFEVPVSTLLDYVIGNMNGYWAGWVAKLESLSGEVNREERAVAAETVDFAVEWCVLGMLRQLYTLRERDVTSKQGAGEYGLNRLPEHFHGLVREALAIRRRKPDRCYDSEARRVKELVELLRYIHEESNRTYYSLRDAT